MPQKTIGDFFSTPKRAKVPAETDEDNEKVQLPSISQKTNPSTDKNNTDDGNDDNSNDKTTDQKKRKSMGRDETAVDISTVTFDTLELALPPDWRHALRGEFTKPYWIKLKKLLAAEAEKKTEIFPPLPHIFSAFHLCAFDDIKVVIIGQDPYHDNNQAMGLAFSVPKTLRLIPPSLKNIYKELQNDIPSITIPTHGDLTSWATQGVFLINTALTVEAHKANSHAKFGWLEFTDAVVNILAKKNKLAWVLWGAPAKTKAKNVNAKTNFIHSSVHPSPLSASRGFFGTSPFTKVNTYLKSQSVAPIQWQLPL